MAVYYDLHTLPVFNNAVLTVGTFDGVHQGHLAILHEVAAHARQVGGESILITFDPHPRKLLFPNQPLGIITPLPTKEMLVQQAGIDHIVVVPFNLEFASMSAVAYIRHFLVDIFRPRSIVIGYDHKFGHDRAGDIDMLKAYAPEGKYELIEIPEQLIDEAAVSSTRIRKALLEGRIEDAATMLGRDYALQGTVVRGNQLGRTIGYPTANISPNYSEQVVPAKGIYAVTAVLNSIRYKGMMSIGLNPTVTNTTNIKIEVNLFDFDLDIYGEQLEVFFVKKLREEVKFPSLEALTDQLAADRLNSLAALADR